VTVLGNTGSLVKTSYSFDGWNTQSDGLGTDYNASGSDSFTMGSANVTLYAKWTALTNHNISLVEGWNLVSFNLQPVNTDIEEVLSSIDGNYNLVYAWDATGAHSGSGNWMKYDPTAPVFANSLDALDETMGFWIRMTVADTLDVVGSAPGTTDISVSDNAGGWNLVAYPSIENRDLPGALSDHGVGTDFSLVYAYHAADTADPWKLFDLVAPVFANDLTEMAPGWGYWVLVSADNVWSVAFSTP